MTEQEKLGSYAMYVAWSKSFGTDPTPIQEWTADRYWLAARQEAFRQFQEQHQCDVADLNRRLGEAVSTIETLRSGTSWRRVSDDTAFAPPFGTIRKCRVCGCLVAGGPTCCVRCVKEEDKAKVARVPKAGDQVVLTYLSDGRLRTVESIWWDGEILNIRTSDEYHVWGRLWRFATDVEVAAGRVL